MTSSDYAVRDGVAVVTLDNPPVNGLGHALRSALLAAIERANADDAVRAIVIAAAGRTFSAGADVREFNTPKAMAEPMLRTLIAAIEGSGKPVIAAIGGTCMGGGFELALGCHHRVALSSAMVALPEVRLGLLPGAGGTQRLPRAVGIETALRLIVTGESMPAGALAGSALFDVITDTDVLGAAVALASEVGAGDRPRQRLRDLPVESENAQAHLRAAREKLVRRGAGPAPALCVDTVAAALTLPFEEGLAFERRQFETLLRSPESRALRHAFFAEREAARIDGMPSDVVARRVDQVGVVGAGTMGSGIAIAFLSAGLPVVLVESAADALERSVGLIRSHFDVAAKRGRIGVGDAQRALGRLRATSSVESLGEADLVVEAVFEDMEIKRALFARLDLVMKPGAILATNTSTLDVDQLAAATGRPADVVGMHFFSPAQVMKLLEVVRAAATAPDVLASVMQVGKRLGKTAVVAGVCDGFIGNRMIEHYLRQAMFCVEEGAPPAQVDAALEGFGMAMGPFRMSDLAGNDVGWRIRQRRYVQRPDRVYPRIADLLCEQGRFGQKTGAGWYRYVVGRREALADPAVDALIGRYRDERGIKPRAFGDAEIVDRCILALVNEGARILEEGIAQRASDIDVVYLAGYGFPRHRGGPMFHADVLGLPEVCRRLAELAAMPIGDAAFFTPAPLLMRRAAPPQ